MSRGEVISSPTDPTLDGYRGSLTLDPTVAKGGPSKVTEPQCAQCGVGFRPSRPTHDICPECWKRNRREEKAEEVEGGIEVDDWGREYAIERAEQEWEETQRRWGMAK